MNANNLTILFLTIAAIANVVAAVFGVRTEIEMRKVERAYGVRK